MLRTPCLRALLGAINCQRSIHRFSLVAQMPSLSRPGSSLAGTLRRIPGYGGTRHGFLHASLTVSCFQNRTHWNSSQEYLALITPDSRIQILKLFTLRIL
jgi:hypothetical protein